MSEVSGGPGWWLASDGRWYPPYAPPSQPPSLPPQTSAPGLGIPRQPRIWPAITALTVGAACVFGGLLLFGIVAVSGFRGDTYRAPVTFVLRCHVGDYDVYQLAASEVSGHESSATKSGLPTLTPKQVTVLGPVGAAVATFKSGGGETASIGSSIFVNTVGFHASTSGLYVVHIAAINPSEVFVAPSLGSQFLRAAPWLILVGAGGVVAIAGLVVLIISLARRGRQVAIPAYYTGPSHPWGTPYTGG